MSKSSLKDEGNHNITRVRDMTGEELNQELKELIDGQFRSNSPKKVYEDMTRYVPTKVRAASI